MSVLLGQFPTAFLKEYLPRFLPGSAVYLPRSTFPLQPFTEDYQHLQNLHTEMQIHIRELTALEHPIETLGSYIVTLMLQRMPVEMRDAW